MPWTDWAGPERGGVRSGGDWSEGDPLTLRHEIQGVVTVVTVGAGAEWLMLWHCGEYWQDVERGRGLEVGSKGEGCEDASVSGREWRWPKTEVGCW